MSLRLSSESRSSTSLVCILSVSTLWTLGSLDSRRLILLVVWCVMTGHETAKSEPRRNRRRGSWHAHGRQAPLFLVVLEAPDATVIIYHSRCCRGSRGLARWPPPRLPCPASSSVCPLFLAAATACAPIACWPMPMTVASTTFCSC